VSTEGHLSLKTLIRKGKKRIKGERGKNKEKDENLSKLVRAMSRAARRECGKKKADNSRSTGMVHHKKRRGTSKEGEKYSKGSMARSSVLESSSKSWCHCDTKKGGGEATEKASSRKFH